MACLITKAVPLLPKLFANTTNLKYFSTYGCFARVDWQTCEIAGELVTEYAELPSRASSQDYSNLIWMKKCSLAQESEEKQGKGYRFSRSLTEFCDMTTQYPLCTWLSHPTALPNKSRLPKKSGGCPKSRGGRVLIGEPCEGRFASWFGSGRV
jgi:hypothetical protein